MGGDDFDWKWLPAQGHSGGILLGTRKETFEVARFSAGQFFISADLIQRNNRTHWELIVVYGPADHSRSVSFLTELHDKISGAMHPVVVGGDFNLMRSPEDNSKNQHLINLHFLDTFNNWIADLELLEVDRVGASFTWTNKQLDPTRCVLHRVFVSPEWERNFPSCSLTAMTRLGSDHCPLLLDSGEA